MSQIIIRPARIEDREKAVFVEGKATPNLHYLNQVYDEWISDPKGKLLVAEIGEELVGVGKFSVMPDDSAWLETLRVLPDYQRRGSGKAFYKEFLTLASSMGIRRLGMYTTPDNLTSKGLAESNGFSISGTFRGSSLIIDELLSSITTNSFDRITDPDTAYKLIRKNMDQWDNYGIMNRTFLRFSPALVSYWTQKGYVYHDAKSDSTIVIGARFMPQQSMHIAYASGDMEKCLQFGVVKTRELGVPKLQCMFPEGNEVISSALQRFGMKLDSFCCIVMECELNY